MAVENFSTHSDEIEKLHWPHHNNWLSEIFQFSHSYILNAIHICILFQPQTKETQEHNVKGKEEKVKKKREKNQKRNKIKFYDPNYKGTREKKNENNKHL